MGLLIHLAKRQKFDEISFPRRFFLLHFFVEIKQRLKRIIITSSSHIWKSPKDSYPFSEANTLLWEQWAYDTHSILFTQSFVLSHLILSTVFFSFTHFCLSFSSPSIGRHIIIVLYTLVSSQIVSRILFARIVCRLSFCVFLATFSSEFFLFCSEHFLCAFCRCWRICRANTRLISRHRYYTLGANHRSLRSTMLSTRTMCAANSVCHTIRTNWKSSATCWPSALGQRRIIGSTGISSGWTSLMERPPFIFMCLRRIDTGFWKARMTRVKMRGRERGNEERIFGWNN